MTGRIRIEAVYLRLTAILNNTSNKYKVARTSQSIHSCSNFSPIVKA